MSDSQPVDTRTLTIKDLHEKLALRTKQLCQNTELSSHLVDLMMREVEAIQEELCARSSDRRKWIFAQLAQLSELITVDAVMNSEYGYKHVKAQEYLNLMMNRAVNQEDFAGMLTLWIRCGTTALLRDKILPLIGYNNDYLPDFNVMVLLDDIGIGYRKNQEVRSVKAEGRKKAAYKVWRTSEVNYVKENYLTKKASELAKELGRSESAIRDRAYSLGMRKNVFKRLSPTGKNTHNRWSEEQLDFLLENYNTMTVTELAVVMNRSDNSIQCKARDLKLRKDPSFFRRKSKKKSPEGTAALAGSDVGFMIADL